MKAWNYISFRIPSLSESSPEHIRRYDVCSEELNNESSVSFVLMITVKNEQHGKGNSRRDLANSKCHIERPRFDSGTVWQFAIHMEKCNSFALSIIRPFNPLNAELNPICHLLALLGAHHILHVSGIRVNGCKNGKNDHGPIPARNIYSSVRFRRAPEPFRTHFGEDQYILQTRALARDSDADNANSGRTKPQKMQRETTYTDNVTVRFDFRNVRRFSRNYTVFTELHGFRETARFSRNYKVFTELRG